MTKQNPQEPTGIQSLASYKQENGFSYLEIAKRFGAKTAQEAVKWVNAGWYVMHHPDRKESLVRVMREKV